MNRRGSMHQRLDALQRCITGLRLDLRGGDWSGVSTLPDCKTTASVEIADSLDGPARALLRLGIGKQPLLKHRIGYLLRPAAS